MGILEGDHVVTEMFTLEFTRAHEFLDIPLKLLFLQKILTTSDAFGKKYIASCCNCNNMGVLAEWLK